MSDTTTTGKVTVGLDLGDRYTQVCVLSEDGQLLEEARAATRAAALRQRFATTDPARIVSEAGMHSPWVSRLLAELGHEVIVANPRKLRLIYQNDQKSDRVDAQYLARLGRLDPSLLAPLVHRSAETQADRALLHSRDALVRAWVLLINHVRGTVKSFGARLPRCATDVFARQAAAALPEELRPALEPVVKTIAHLSTEVLALDHQMEELAVRYYPETQLLQQVPGWGALTALTFVLTVEDPHRFSKSRAVGAYLGSAPPPAGLRGDTAPAPYHQSRGRDAPPSAGHLRSPHPGALRTGQPSASLGTHAGRTGRQERQETRRGGGGPQAGRAASAAVGHRRGL